MRNLITTDPSSETIQPVIDYWNSIQVMPPELVAEIRKKITVRTFKKGDMLLVPGKVANHACFILEGLVKSYYEKEDGVSEVVTKFLYEGTIITSIFSYYSRQPGNESIIALEDTTIACLSYDAMQDLLKHHAVFNYIIRVITERYLFFLEVELYNMRKPLAEDRYQFFLKHFPQLLQRLALKDIASYLGMSLETLSRVRGRFRRI